VGAVKQVASCVLICTGAVLVLAALLAALGSALALRERLRYGPGLMFADVEFLGLTALVCGAVGGLVLFTGTRLARRPSTDRAKPLGSKGATERSSQAESRNGD